jgi:hypothetical protein
VNSSPLRRIPGQMVVPLAPEGAKDFSPWRKPWGSKPARVSQAPEGRKKPLLLLKATPAALTLFVRVWPMAFAPPGLGKIVTPIEVPRLAPWAKICRPSGPGTGAGGGDTAATGKTW